MGMLAANVSLKNNRKLVKKRTLRTKEDYLQTTSKTTVVFKKTTPEQMDAVKATIRANRRTELLVSAIAAVATIGVPLLIYWLLP